MAIQLKVAGSYSDATISVKRAAAYQQATVYVKTASAYEDVSGGGSGPTDPSLDFSDAANSMYLALRSVGGM